MSRNLYIFLLGVNLCITLNSYSQTVRKNYELLWKISGNGLKKPSYLFGTMHLRDEKVFDFSDSVLAKFTECEIFSMEITPDSLMAELLPEIMKQRDSLLSVPELLTKQEFELLEKKLIKKTGKRYSELQYNDPQSILQLLTSKASKKTDKSTFLDAYLYRLATEEQKQVVGLEHAKDQMDIFKGSDYLAAELRKIVYDVDHENAEEKFIEKYWLGDLSQINAYFVDFDTSAVESLLYRRNSKMVEKAKTYMGDSSLFIAVGAAHLGGPRGMIDLFKKQGYTVTKVPATFTGLAKKYVEKTIHAKWKKFVSEENKYSLEMPALPTPHTDSKNSTKSSKIYMYPDISTGLFYYTMAGTFANDKTVDAEKRFAIFFNNINGTKSMKGVKKLKYKGYEAREMDFFKPAVGMHMRARVIIRNNTFHAIMAGAMAKETMKNADVERYFSSMEFLEYGSAKMEKYVSDEGAFSITAPFKFTHQSVDVKNDAGIVKANISTASDLEKGIHFLAAYYQLPVGTYSTNDSLYIGSSLDALQIRTGGDFVEKQNISLEGYPGVSYTINTKTGSVYKGKIYLRGSRPYNFFVLCSDKDQNDPVIDAYLNSFAFEDFKKTDWTSYKNEQHHFAINVPSQVSISIDSTTLKNGRFDEENYSFQEGGSGISFAVSLNHFGAYFYKTKKDFFEKIREDYVGTTDSILWQKDFSIKGIKGVSYLLKTKENYSLKRIHAIPKDNDLYIIYAYLPPEMAESKEANSFFNSFTFTEASPGTTIYDNKTAVLLKDLCSTDSVTLEDSRDNLYGYTFEKNEIPFIYKALAKKYADDTLSYSGTRAKLLSKVSSFKDSGQSKFIEGLYPSLEQYPRLQLSALEALLDLRSAESVRTFVSLSKNNVPAYNFLPYNFFYSLEDSIAYNAEVLPQIFYLHKDKKFRPDVLSLASTLLDSSKVPSAFFDASLPGILQLAKQDLDTINNQKKTDNYPDTRSLASATAFLAHWHGNTEINKFFETLSLHPLHSIAMQATKILLQEKVALKQNVLENLAADINYRLELYEMLKELGLLSQFPPKWAKQKYFAESFLAIMLDEAELYPEKTELINTKVAEYKGIQSRFFVYKYLTDGQWYAAISGPFSLKESVLETSSSATKTLYELLDSKSINEHFNALLKEE